MFQNKRPLIFLLVTLVGGGLVTQQSVGMFASTYASESSPYDSGYDHGCDDAGRSESDKYINEPEKGPSFHTNEFMNGYYAGLSACSSGGNGGEGDFDQPREIQPHNPPQSGGIDWENLCNQYGHLVGIKDPCYEYANGIQLTEKGKTALVCLLGGGITLLAGLDPATKTEIIALGQQYCP